MREFENIVYMDLQKAATTTIVALLRKIVDEKECPHSCHAPAERGHDADRFHFISVRNPLGIYISLYGHGCTRRGGMYKGFKKRGLEHMYEPSLPAFECWLDFMLDPANASLIKRKYGEIGMSDQYAPITYRLIMLSIVNPIEKIKKRSFDDRKGLRDFFDRRRIYDYYVRTEHLAEDLFGALSLCSNKVRFNQPLTTLDEFKTLIPKKNVGTRIEGLTTATVSDELQKRVREREWLLYEVFGYDQDPRGRRPPLPTPRRRAAA